MQNSAHRTQSHLGEQAKRLDSGKGKKHIAELDKALESLAELDLDDSTTHAEQMIWAEVSRTKWQEEATLPNGLLSMEGLVSCQRQRCREIGMIMLGLVLHEQQVDAVCTLFYQKKRYSSSGLARMGFGKSFIFHLLPFIFNPDLLQR